MTSPAETPLQRTPQIKSYPVTVRLSEHLDAKLDHAAELSEMSRSELIRAAITEKVDAILEAHGVTILSDWDMDTLLDAIANPPPPNAAMLRSLDRWRKHVRQDDSTASG